MKRDRLYKAISIFLLIFLALSISACDGLIGVKGRVYEWAQPDKNSKSIVYIDEFNSIPPPRLTPIKGAEVVIEPWTPTEKSKISSPELSILKAKTDDSGYFESSITAKPGAYDATIIVSCPGYLPVERIFKHDRFFHNAIVVLVREKSL